MDYEDDEEPVRRVRKMRTTAEEQSTPPLPRRRRPPPEPAAAASPQSPPPDGSDDGAAEDPPAEEPGEERTGYGRPPKHSRFKKGQSGNPKGRPKGAKSSRTILKKIGEEIVKVRGPDGKPLKMSRKELSLRKLWERAANGDPKALAILMGTWANEEVSQQVEEALTPTQQAILRAHGIDIDEGEDK